MKIVKSILEDWLKENGYDGLCDYLGRCSCLIKDIAPCEQDCRYCAPGYKHLDENGLWYIANKTPKTLKGGNI